MKNLKLYQICHGLSLMFSKHSNWDTLTDVTASLRSILFAKNKIGIRRCLISERENETIIILPAFWSFPPQSLKLKFTKIVFQSLLSVLHVHNKHLKTYTVRQVFEWYENLKNTFCKTICPLVQALKHRRVRWKLGAH